MCSRAVQALPVGLYRRAAGKPLLYKIRCDVAKKGSVGNEENNRRN
nr:MAG TPA: hypothetical protein [Caudoviricetes sp.]